MTRSTACTLCAGQGIPDGGNAAGGQQVWLGRESTSPCCYNTVHSYHIACSTEVHHMPPCFLPVLRVFWLYVGARSTGWSTTRGSRWVRRPHAHVCTHTHARNSADFAPFARQHRVSAVRIGVRVRVQALVVSCTVTSRSYGSLPHSFLALSVQVLLRQLTRLSR